jgi:glycerate dehydrogenase
MDFSGKFSSFPYLYQKRNQVMRIVFLDAYTSNHGDLDWAGLEQLGELLIYDRTESEKVVERAKEADILIVNKVVLTEAVLSSLPNLKYVCVAATGFNNVDLVAARKYGIPVSNVVGYSTQSVAQLVFALLLALNNRVSHYSEEVRNGFWSAGPDFSYWHEPIIELDGLNFGIYGFGKIGQASARIALSFGMNVIALHKHPERNKMDGVRFVGWEELLEKSDVLSLHAPLTPENKGIFNMEVFTKMKKSAILINTSRGPVIDEKDLAAALNEGIIAGAGLDVLSQEPPERDNPLLQAKHCMITPHHAWASQAARKRLLHGIAENIASFQKGKILNRVS